MISHSRFHNVVYQLLCLVLISVALLSCTEPKKIIVSNQQEFSAAVSELKAGDTLVMANGNWIDFEILFEGNGKSSAPITLTAQEPGKVILSGKSNLRLSGEHLVVSDLVFKNGYTPTNGVIEFRRSKKSLANNSRVTRVVIDNYNNPERTEVDYWVMMYGKNNRFDHNHIEGKRNRGVTLAVRLDTKESLDNHHRIDHNYFGPRQVLGSNGGETIRIGTSHYSLSASNTVVENNYFDRCDGEVEIVSSKSGGNIFRNNFFFESRGTLTLRHGNDNLVEENVFIGNGVDHTGGFRVINKRQTVRNNYLQGLTGYRFGGGLVIMNGVPDSPINRYHQVDKALIENNSLINVDHIQLAAGSDAERSAAPVNSQFKNNLIYNENKENNITIFDDISGIKFENNVLHDVKSPAINSGFNSQNVILQKAENGLLYPADEALAKIGVKKGIKPIQKDQTGVAWYAKPDNSIKFGTGRVIDIQPAPGALFNAVAEAKAGDTIRLADGNYVVKKFLVIDKPITITSSGALDAVGPGKNRVNIDFRRSTLFEIADGGSLQLRGLNISGKNSPDNVGNSVIRTSRYSMLVNYVLKIESCEFKDLNVNRAFNVVNVSKSTFADNIEISNSSFTDVSGAILKLDKETDDYGLYNAEYVSIKDSSFSSVKGTLIDLYRGGTDESTFGPHFLLTGSKLDNVGKGSKNKSKSSVHLHGVQVTLMEGNHFVESAPVKILHTVGEPKTRIIRNTFQSTELLPVVELNSKKTNTAIIQDNVSDMESH